MLAIVIVQFGLLWSWNLPNDARLTAMGTRIERLEKQVAQLEMELAKVRGKMPSGEGRSIGDFSPWYGA